MTIIDVIGIFLGLVACIAATFFLPVLVVNLIDHIVESYRRNKHPDYFEYWDEAVSLSFKIGGKLSTEKRRVQHYIKLYVDGYRDGECTAEYITKNMAKVTQWWIEACDTYNKEYSEVKVLLEKADRYAKAHNLKWGIIHET